MYKWLEHLLAISEKLGLAQGASKPLTSFTISRRFSWTGYRKMTYQPKYFNSDEVKGLNPELVILLDKIRHDCGFSFVITSGFRSGDEKAHGLGAAADVRSQTSWQRFKIVQTALKYGIVRIGVYNKHVHIDICTDKGFPQNVLWTGISQ